MSIENGGPAFPCRDLIERDENGHYKGEPIGAQGLTMRDYFAAKALNALLSDAPSGTSFGVNHMITNMNYALASYAIADAMLEARNATPE